MKRFDFDGTKLNHNLDFPTKFAFERDFMNEDLAKHEINGW